METFVWFIILIILYLSTISMIPTTLSIINKYQMKYYGNYVQETFKLKKWCYFIKENIHKYLIWSYVYIFFNFIVLGAFVALWIIIWKNPFYLLGFFIIFLISFFFTIKISISLKNKILKLNVCRKNEAIKKFTKYIKDNANKNLKITENFIILKNNEFDFLTKVVKFNYKRFSRKISKINDKNLNQKIEKSLKIFNFYLKRFANLITIRITTQDNIFKLKVNNKSYNINVLPEIILNNLASLIYEKISN